MSSPSRKALATLLGVVLGFAAAVWLGRAAEHYSKPGNFVRFHYQISPESLFYPPFSMLENLALARAKPGKTVVIVAGNSILNGYGQKEKDLWSLRLQEQLGERYAVLNLAFRGTLPCEAGALVAESLLKRGVPVVLVTNTSPGNVGRVAGGPYGYLFYDALYKDRLIDYAPRVADLAAWESIAPPAQRHQQEELRRAARLDAIFHFQALWHHVGYRHAFTVWNELTRDRFWRARDGYPDNLPDAPPLAERFRGDPAAEVAITRAFSSNLAEPDGAGGWRLLAPALAVTSDLIHHMFPPPLRPHTVLLLNQNAPIYRRQLTDSERARDELAYAGYAQLWRDHGIAAHVVGGDFTDNDFLDRTHLSAPGGEKLARLTAAYIRELSPQ